MKWIDVAKVIGAKDNEQIDGGLTNAKLAICELLGSEFIIESVHMYINNDPSSELIRSVLWQIKPLDGMMECYEIFNSPNYTLQQKRNAIELLKVISDERCLCWIEEILESGDFKIQCLGAEVISQLVYEHLVEEQQIKELIDKLDSHKHFAIKDEAASIKLMLKNLE